MSRQLYYQLQELMERVTALENQMAELTVKAVKPCEVVEDGKKRPYRKRDSEPDRAGGS